MKVLLLFPMKDNQTGLFIYRSLLELGCDVKTVDAKTEKAKALDEIKAYRPNFILCSRTPGLDVPMRYVGEKFPKMVTACWNVDKRNDVMEFQNDVGNVMPLFRAVDILYTVGLGNVAQYKKLCPKPIVKHLQQGIDPKTHKRENLSQQDHDKYDCDIMFAGSLHGHPGRKHWWNEIEKLAKVKGYKLKLWGYQKFDKIYDSDHNKACQCAKIVLGHNGWPDVDISMSVRDYKIMGAGGFLLTEHCKRIGDWFKLDEEIVTYKDTTECLKKIIYYMEHDQERIKIANTGHDIVHAKHTYTHRVRQMLEDAENVLSKRESKVRIK